MKWLQKSKLSGVILFCCLSIIVFTKCITPYEPGGVTSTKGLLVVEAYIIAPTGSSIKISRTNGLQDNRDYDKISNAKVTIINDKGDVVATAQEGKPGEYMVKNPIAFLPNTKYALDIVIGSTHFQSTFEEPLVTPEIDDLNWVSKSDGREVDILLSTHDPLQKTEYYLWQYKEDWEYTSQFYASDRWDPETRRVIPNTFNDNTYYCWNQDSSKSFILAGAKTLQDGILRDKVIVNLKSGDTRFSHLYSILVKQYSIPYGAYKYYENLYKNVNESGSLFAPMPTQMAGNITNLANPDELVIGYALISTETSKRIYINAREVPYMNPFRSDCLLGPPPEDEINSPEKAYNSGWGIYTSENFIYEYRQLKCVDCRTLGGGKIKPNFWPTNHL